MKLGQCFWNSLTLDASFSPSPHNLELMECLRSVSLVSVCSDFGTETLTKESDKKKEILLHLASCT